MLFAGLRPRRSARRLFAWVPTPPDTPCATAGLHAVPLGLGSQRTAPCRSTLRNEETYGQALGRGQETRAEQTRA